MSIFLGLGLHPEYFSLTAADENQILAVAVLELSRPFDLNHLRDGNWALQYYTETLLSLHEKIGNRGRQVGVVLDNSMVLLKKVPTAMGLEEELIQDQMQWEADQLLISPLDQFSLVFDRLPFSTPSGNPIYLQVLVRKKLIETVQKMISLSGLQISDLDVDYFSIIRCISVNYESDPKDISVIVDFHRDCIGLVFIRKQEYFLSYKLFLHGAVDESAELVKLVLKDLRRIVFGHGLGKGVEDIHRFFILDHVSRKDFIDAFSDAVGVPVEGIQPFRKMVLSAEVSESNELALLPERFVTSIGAVLKKLPSLVK